MNVVVNDFQLETEAPGSAEAPHPAEASMAQPSIWPDDVERIARRLAERAARLVAD